MFQGLSLLTNLTCLNMCEDDSKFPQTHEYDIDIEWDRLLALQTLSIHAVTLHVGPGVTGLLQLSHLKQVLLSEIKLHDQSENACFAALIDSLAMHCPQVKVDIHSRGWPNHFEESSKSDLKVSDVEIDSS